MVKIRMRRTGCTNHATYRIVAADERSPRDGKFLEILGWYDTQIKDDNFKLDIARVDYWLEGCQALDHGRLAHPSRQEPQCEAASRSQGRSQGGSAEGLRR